MKNGPSLLFLALFALLGDCLSIAADKSGVYPETILLPKGPGSIESLGEAFQPTLNTATAKYGIGVEVAPDTAGQTHGLHLASEGAGGNGPAGFGWPLASSSIQRSTGQGIFRPRSALSGAPVGRSERRKAATSQAVVEDLPVNANTMGQEVPVTAAQVGHQAALKPNFEQPNAAHHEHALRSSQTPGGSLVNDGQVGPQSGGQQDSRHLARPQGMLSAQAVHLRRGSERVFLDPGRVCDGLGRRPAGSIHHDFTAHLLRNMDLCEKPMEQIKLADPRQRNERGGVGDDDYNLSVAAAARSSASSAAV